MQQGAGVVTHNSSSAPRGDRQHSVRRARRRAFAWIAAYLALICAPLLVLLLGDMPPAVGFLWDFSMGLGFGGLAVFGVQFALTARIRRASSPFGIDVIYVLHRYLAWLALILVGTHFAILWLFHTDALGVLDPREARWELTSGRAALLLLALAVVTSQWRKVLRLEYGLWRYLHVGLAVMGFAAAVAHILGVGRYTSVSSKTALWVVLTLSWLALIAWVRIVKPWGQSRHPYQVAEVRSETDDAVTLVIEPVGHAGLRRFKPGQFAWLTLRSSPYLLREHPFSMTSAPEDLPRMSFGIKELGDFTRAIRGVKPGEAVYLDGPYGVFSIDDHPSAAGYVFIVGGIGMTPALSMLRSLAAREDPRPLWIFYCNNTLADRIYSDELATLARSLDLRIVTVISEPPEDWDGESGYLTQDILARHLPSDKDELVYFLCGPTPMTSAATEALVRLGVPREQIRSEIFELA